MRRFFISSPVQDEKKVVLTGEEAHHAIHVLRISPRDTVFLFDGTGKQWEAEVLEVTKNSFTAAILSEQESFTETKISITLAQAVAKGERMDFLLQKCTELGVKVFLPLFTARTIVRLSTQDFSAKQLRWQKICLEAAKQSGRVVPPKVLAPCNLSQLIPVFSEYELILFCWEKERLQNLHDVLNSIPDSPENILIIIGPEGGWEPSEADFLIKAGAKSISLGPRILRSETAGIVLVTALLYHFYEI